MAKILDFFNGYKSIFHSILLSHKNYRNMCHTDKTLCFVSAYKSIFWYQSGIVWMLTPCHGKTNVTCVTWPKLAVCRWLYIVFSMLTLCHVKTTVTCVTWPKWWIFSMLLHQYFIPSFSCHVKTNVRCVTRPKSAVCRLIYISIPCHSKTTVTCVTWTKCWIFSMLIHQYFIPSFFCHGKTTVTCVTRPELTVYRDCWMMNLCHGKTNVTCVTWLNWLFADGYT